ncbi:S-adenosyl-L-methionine-dependent methyltransferase [Xylariomycetidae sp. FL2044]|nr:S-adenosyl-L-methionine-dependent methyltransferase [Xylariomycetidae sp. FL2044]
MPPKNKSTPKKKPAVSSAGGRKPPETKEDFENELKLLAEQGKHDTWRSWFYQQVNLYGKALFSIISMSYYANVSLLNLSPVYGAVAAERWHERVVWAALFIGWGANVALRQNLPTKTINLLPLVAFYVPMLQRFLYTYSSRFGAEWGPAITESLTLLPVLVLSTACLADTLEGVELGGLPKSVASSVPGIASYALFKSIETASMRQAFTEIGKSIVHTRVGLELLLAATYGVAARSKLIIFAVPAILHAVFWNPHLMTPMSTNSLNATLNRNGWSLMDRWESNTGYISVINSHRDGFRALRCDHSLLGGEWTKLDRVIVGEPIYSVFTQLEAVRLIENPGKTPDHEAKALNIGLGIGTTPSALIAHGIDTTIVEIDPVVYEFAKKYFSLPSNHTAVIQDVVSWSKENMGNLESQYDYIVHDVFTGGAEPIALFTDDFLLSLKSMLKPNGVIAINYAGDFTLPPLSIVVNTIRQVFPSCRVFRESPAPSAEKLAAEGRDFDNVIVFCRKSSSDDDAPITFREPVEADYLRSLARRAYLVPKHEVDIESAFRPLEEVGTLRVNETAKLAEWHDRGALGHWAVMRTVLPEEIWNMW